MSNYAEGQDWSTAGWSKQGRNGRIGSESKEQAINRIKRTGGPLETTHTQYGGTNKSSHTRTDVNMRKLEEESEHFKHNTVDRSLSQALQKARAAKGMTQKELATAINEKPQVIGEYESGKAIPNPQIINKLERALAAKLPRGKKKTDK